MKILAFILPFIFVGPAYCQQNDGATNVNVFVGAGYPEMFHGGIRVDHKQWHFDASSGTTFREKEFTLNGNAALHLGKKRSEFSAQKPWYTSLGMSYVQWTELGSNDSTNVSIVTPGSSTETQQGTQEIQALGKRTYINGRFGRDFRINNRFNLSLSLGLGVIAYEKVHYYVGGPGIWEGLRLPIIPSGQFSFQFKL